MSKGEYDIRMLDFRIRLFAVKIFAMFGLFSNDQMHNMLDNLEFEFKAFQKLARGK